MSQLNDLIQQKKSKEVVKENAEKFVELLVQKAQEIFLEIPLIKTVAWTHCVHAKVSEIQDFGFANYAPLETHAGLLSVSFRKPLAEKWLVDPYVLKERLNERQMKLLSNFEWYLEAGVEFLEEFFSPNMTVRIDSTGYEQTPYELS